MQDKEESLTYKEYLQVLKECSPYDFSEYSDSSIDRRIQKVIRDYNISMDELIHKTRTDEVFVEQVVEAITVNTTELFRDPHVWAYMRDIVIPQLKSRPKINIWHAGCSTGQEVYSDMIVLHSMGLLDKCDIYASDISKKAIELAKKGVYRNTFNNDKYKENFKTVFEGTDVPDFNTYFDVRESDDRIEVKPFLLDKVKYIKHDLVKEEQAFYNKFDLIFCRNVLIYFNSGLQSRIVQRFYDNLFPGGILVLGAHEALTGFFKTKFAKNGPVYTRTNSFRMKY
jgi:chemotaxis protein methyltransferase CheR